MTKVNARRYEFVPQDQNQRQQNENNMCFALEKYTAEL
jgi:hypothetical protein